MTDSTPSPQRRRHLRVMRPGITAEFTAAGKTCTVRILDVSEGGAFVTHQEPNLVRGTEVVLSQCGGSDLALAGRVAQVLPRQGPFPSGYGLEFDAPPKDTLERVTGRQAPACSLSVAGDGVAQSQLADVRALFLLSEPLLAESMAAALKSSGVGAVITEDPTEALRWAAHGKERLKLLVVDTRLPGAHANTLKKLGAATDGAKMVVVSDKLPLAPERQAFLDAGADRMLLSPVDPFVFLNLSHRACDA